MIAARPSAVLTYAGLICALSAIAWKRQHLTLTRAVSVGVLGAALHLVSVLVHHAGHAVAARMVGHPMIGVRLWGGLASSLYPEGEPELPPNVHLRRAIGGPLASAVVGLGVATLGRRRGGVVGDLTTLVVADNLFLLGLGSLLPLGFTDGSTLLALRGRGLR